MPLIIGLYVMKLYATNYWLVCDLFLGFLCRLIAHILSIRVVVIFRLKHVMISDYVSEVAHMQVKLTLKV